MQLGKFIRGNDAPMYCAGNVKITGSRNKT